MRKLLAIFGAIAYLVVTNVRPVSAALQPLINVKLYANSVQNGDKWENFVRAKGGEEVQFRAEISNVGQVTAQDVRIRIDFTPNHPVPDPGVTIYVSSANSDFDDTHHATVMIDGQTSGTLDFIPGRTVGGLGSGQALSPDTETANITTQEISIGDVPPHPRLAQVVFYARVNAPTPTLRVLPTSAPRTGIGGAAIPTSTPRPFSPTLTPTPMPTGASLQPVAPRTPSTGFPVGIMIASLAGVGLIGWAMVKKSQRVW
jgi:hypothetical protein